MEKRDFVYFYKINEATMEYLTEFEVSLAKQNHK